MELTEEKLKSIIKEVLKEGFFGDTPMYDQNIDYVNLNAQNVKSNKIYIPQWGDNGVTIDLNAATPCKGGWMFATRPFKQTVDSSFSGEKAYLCQNCFIKKGNGQMVYAVNRTGGNPNYIIGVELRGGYVINNGNGLSIQLK